MHRALDLPGSAPRVILPTTTTKMASRMLSASRIVGEALPIGLFTSPALDIMLALHVAEDDATYFTVDKVQSPSSSSAAVTRRWVNALVQLGYVEHRDGLIALSDKGHQIIIDVISAVYTVQRELDAS